MGIGGWFGKTMEVTRRWSIISVKANEAAEQHFEPQLARLGLGKDQIEAQDLKELEKNLDIVNEAIENPGPFGTAKIKVDAEGIPWISSDGILEIPIGPILLKRKKLMLDRITSLKEEEAIGTLHNQAEKVTDATIKSELQEGFRKLRAETRDGEKRSREVDEAITREQAKVEAELVR